MPETTNRGYHKPLETDAYDINKLNENLDKIDSDITLLNEKIEGQDFSTFAQKGGILPQDIKWLKTNTHKRIYNRVEVINESSDNAAIYTNYVNEDRGVFSNTYYFKNLKIIKDLKTKDTELLNLINEYKGLVDDYSRNLGDYINRHEVANNELSRLLRG